MPKTQIFTLIPALLNQFYGVLSPNRFVLNLKRMNAPAIDKKKYFIRDGFN
jgi:hypothetical protein